MKNSIIKSIKVKYKVILKVAYIIKKLNFINDPLIVEQVWVIELRNK